MFTQQISMDCSEEQYKELFPLLHEMGYVEGRGGASEKQIIVNNWEGCHGEVGLTFNGREHENGREYLGEFNAPLFLARAAMTDSIYGGVGEYWKFTDDSTEKWTNGKLYRALKPIDDDFAFIDNTGAKNGRHPCNNRNFRKATVEEITNHFTNKVMEKENTFTTTRSQMGKIHGIACSTWKPKIVEYTRQYGNTFDDAVVLPQNVVEEMFAAATTEQVPVLKSVFPEFKKDKNAFISTFNADDIKDVSKMLFGKDEVLQIADVAASHLDIEKSIKLRGRSFYLYPGFTATIHENLGEDKGSIIEISKNRI